MNCSGNCDCATCSNKAKGKNMGLFLLRVVTGIFFIMTGLGKMQATPEMQEMIGGAGHMLGLTFISKVAWFQIVMWAEIVGGTLLALGLLTGVGSILILMVMVGAMNLKGWNFDMMSANNAVLDGFLTLIALTLMFTGAGKWSLDRVLCKPKYDVSGKGPVPSCGCCSPGCQCGDCAECK